MPALKLFTVGDSTSLFGNKEKKNRQLLGKNSVKIGKNLAIFSAKTRQNSEIKS